jgi:outer membrane protein TolC
MNKSIRFLFVAALVLLTAASGARADANVTNQVKSLTLRECVERALRIIFEIKLNALTGDGSWGRTTPGIRIRASATPMDADPPLDPNTAKSLGLSSLKQQTLNSSVGLTGILPTGASYDLSGNSTRTSGDLTSNFVYTGSAGVSLTQPILKNFGLGVNSATIRIARETQSIALQTFVQLVMSKINDVSTAYYELIFAIENHKSALETRALNQQLLDENRKREQVGTMSPLDVIQAESGVANSEQAVITTERAIKDNENTLKRLICQRVSELRGVSLVPVDYPLVQMVAMDVDLSTATALEKRADYLSLKARFGKAKYLSCSLTVTNFGRD